MSRAEKQLEAMRNNAIGWRYEQVKRQLTRADFYETSREGSHRTWKHREDRKLFTVKDPGNGDVKPGYIKEMVRRIDRIHAKGDAP